MPPCPTLILFFFFFKETSPVKEDSLFEWILEVFKPVDSDSLESVYYIQASSKLHQSGTVQIPGVFHLEGFDWISRKVPFKIKKKKKSTLNDTH